MLVSSFYFKENLIKFVNDVTAFAPKNAGKISNLAGEC